MPKLRLDQFLVLWGLMVTSAVGCLWGQDGPGQPASVRVAHRTTGLPEGRPSGYKTYPRIVRSPDLSLEGLDLLESMHRFAGAVRPCCWAKWLAQPGLKGGKDADHVRLEYKTLSRAAERDSHTRAELLAFEATPLARWLYVQLFDGAPVGLPDTCSAPRWFHQSMFMAVASSNATPKQVVQSMLTVAETFPVSFKEEIEHPCDLASECLSPELLCSNLWTLKHADPSDGEAMDLFNRAVKGPLGRIWARFHPKKIRLADGTEMEMVIPSGIVGGIVGGPGRVLNDYDPSKVLYSPVTVAPALDLDPAIGLRVGAQWTWASMELQLDEAGVPEHVIPRGLDDEPAIQDWALRYGARWRFDLKQAPFLHRVFIWVGYRRVLPEEAAAAGGALWETKCMVEPIANGCDTQFVPGS